MHFVNRLPDGTYQGTRKLVSGKMYVCRTPLTGCQLSEARVFNTAAAAKNSANKANIYDVETIAVGIIEKPEV